jgi:hypothetical protein
MLGRKDYTREEVEPMRSSTHGFRLTWRHDPLDQLKLDAARVGDLAIALDAKPSADRSSLNPKWSLTKAAEAATSSTLSEMADAVIFTACAPFHSARW